MYKYLVLFLWQCQMLEFINVDTLYFDDGELLELEENEYLVTQNIINATFYLIVGSYDIPKYIFLEIKFLTPQDGDVNFITTIAKNQLTKFENSQLIATYVDLNGYYGKKNYHNIIIPANSFQTGDKFFMTNLIRNDRRSYQYYLKLRKLPYQPCPNNCSSAMGKCVDGVCSCIMNQIDLDCSKKATVLNFEEKIENITIKGTQYFYFEQQTQLENIQFQLDLEDNNQVEGSVISLYYMFEDFKFGVPTQLHKNFTLQKDVIATYKITIDISSLNYNANLLRFDRLIIKVISQQEVKCNILIGPLESDSDSDGNISQIVIYVSSSIGAFFVIILIAIIIYRCQIRQRFYSQVFQLRDQIINNPHQQDFNFTVEFLNKNMKKFQKNKKYDYQICSICLSDDAFENKGLRLTQCNHPFHPQCLYEWLCKTQEKWQCPNCRSLIDINKMRSSGDNDNLLKSEESFENIQDQGNN